MTASSPHHTEKPAGSKPAVLSGRSSRFWREQVIEPGDLLGGLALGCPVRRVVFGRQPGVLCASGTQTSYRLPKSVCASFTDNLSRMTWCDGLGYG